MEAEPRDGSLRLLSKFFLSQPQVSDETATANMF